jgi:hypothetical protein
MTSPDSISALLAEGDTTSGPRSRERARQYIGEFKTALGLPPKGKSPIDPALEEFLIEVVLGAAWYQSRYRGAGCKVWAYVALNCVLVVGLPLGLIGLGSLAKGPTAAIGSQIAGVLTGILALQKTLSTWYASQQRYAVWYKSASDLKAIYYAFVQTWEGKADQSDFETALNQGTAAARKIISDEQLDFYQKLSLPSFDVLDMLTATRGTVSNLVSSLLPGTPPSTVTVLGKNVLAAPVNAVPIQTGVGPAGSGAISPQVQIRVAGANKPNDNPYTIVIIANPAIESPVDSGKFVPDPILGSPATFEACVQHVMASVFGRLAGQAETFMAQFSQQIRVISIFDPSLGPTAANALVGEYAMGGLVGPRQAQFTALLAQYKYNGQPVVADVAFAITSSATYNRSSSFYTYDDDSSAGVPFQIDGKTLAHRFANYYPGAVALHSSADSVVALHEFGHAASSWTNGSVKDLYVDSDMTNGPINIRAGRPVPAYFADYNGTVFQSDLSRDSLGYPAGWNSYHCALVAPASPAIMDDFWRASSNHPEDCMHDEITVRFLTDRIKAIMARP